MLDLRQFRLKNGLPVIVLPLNHLHTTDISLFVRMGSRFENRRNNGISHLLEHVLFRGTRTDPNSSRFSSRVESLAGDLSAATYRDFAYFNLSLPPESFSEGLRLFSQMFTQPVMEGFEREKGVIREEILEDMNEEGRSVNIIDLSRAVLFSGHPLGLKVAGDAKNIERFTRTASKMQLDRFFCAKNMILAISGAIPLELEARIERSPFTRLHGGAPILYSRFVHRRRKRQQYVFHHPNKDVQLVIQLCFRGLPEEHPLFLYFVLLSRLLGEGISSRLYRAVCERGGLAYSIDASLDIFAETSLLDIDFQVSPEKALRATRVVLQELLRVRRQGITAAELKKAKRRSLHTLRSLYDNPFALARWYCVPYLYGKQRSIEEVEAELTRIRLEPFRRVASLLLRRHNLWLHLLGDVTPRTFQRFHRLTALLR